MEYIIRMKLEEINNQLRRVEGYIRGRLIARKKKLLSELRLIRTHR
jgi:hypothetical protein